MVIPLEIGELPIPNAEYDRQPVEDLSNMYQLKINE